MAEDIVMPRLSDSMEEGTVLKWMKAVGDEVALGDELVEIETDKANMVFESDAAGTLIEIVAPEGETLPIGEVIARVGEAGEAPSGDGGGGGGCGRRGRAECERGEAWGPRSGALRRPGSAGCAGKSSRPCCGCPCRRSPPPPLRAPAHPRRRALRPPLRQPVPLRRAS